ncbi:MAG: cytochrome c biogenesis protein ResB [Planctomycetes bacterium]|nr:cytochrome c biogenesis protein ResB [Planctomycetota bacterium]
MSRFQRGVLWATLLAIILLTLLSIYGAFLGAARAQALFNSLPLAVYWFALTALLIVGIAVFRRLYRVPALLLMHLGCILVLLGAMWGSQGGHALAKQLFGIDKIPRGRMGILEQMQENRVLVADSNSTRELPFSVRLKDFRLEHYEPGYLVIWTREGGSWRLPAREGQSLRLSDELGTVTVRRVFKSFRIDMRGEERVAYEAPDGSNPALEVSVEIPGKPPGRRYVFEQTRGHTKPDDPLIMSYSRAVRDYISELEIVQNGQVVAAKDIEVNHPLYYGGYHFYQHEYGVADLGEYTVLLVVSDAGLPLVFGGYALLMAGIFWHFWGQRLLRRSCVPARGRSTGVPPMSTTGILPVNVSDVHGRDAHATGPPNAK